MQNKPIVLTGRNLKAFVNESASPILLTGSNLRGFINESVESVLIEEGLGSFFKGIKGGIKQGSDIKKLHDYMDAVEKMRKQFDTITRNMKRIVSDEQEQIMHKILDKLLVGIESSIDRKTNGQLYEPEYEESYIKTKMERELERQGEEEMRAEDGYDEELDNDEVIQNASGEGRDYRHTYNQLPDDEKPQPSQQEDETEEEEDETEEEEEQQRPQVSTMVGGSSSNSNKRILGIGNNGPKIKRGTKKKKRNRR